MQCDTRYVYMYSTSTAVEIQDSPCPSQCTRNMTLYVQVYPLMGNHCVFFESARKKQGDKWLHCQFTNMYMYMHIILRLQKYIT